MRNYCKENLLSINCNKSKIVIFQKGCKRKHSHLFLEGNEIEVVKQYKYLAVTLSISGAFEKKCENATTSAKIASGRILDIIASQNQILGMQKKNFSTVWWFLPCYIMWKRGGLRYLDEIQTLASLERNKENWVNEFVKSKRDLDRERLCKSSRLQIYPQLEHIPRRARYLDIEMRIEFTRLITQFRLFIDENYRIVWQGKNFKFNDSIYLLLKFFSES